MHHKRKKTSTRKEGKRMEHKSIRMRERQAIGGGRVQEPRKDRWGGSPEIIPIIYEDHQKQGTAGSRSKRKPRAKERCPVNGRHEWYSEPVEEHGSEVTHSRDYTYNCLACRELNYYVSPITGERIYTYVRDYCPDHRVVRKYTYKYTLKTCIHCWQTKKSPRRPERLYDDGQGRWYTWRSSRKLILKKRSVQLY